MFAPERVTPPPPKKKKEKYVFNLRSAWYIEQQVSMYVYHAEGTRSLYFPSYYAKPF